MDYITWFDAHGNKHKNIMQKLKSFSDQDVIAYFRFENMIEKEPDFCTLYNENKKCHEMDILNCYLCACPYFRFDDDGLSKEDVLVLYSTCSIEAKKGARFVSNNAIHQDCSGCTIPHNEATIKKHFSRDWFEIMQNVKQNKV